MIICIGDSHSSVFSGKEKIITRWPGKEYNLFSKFKPIRIGPATAYNLQSKVALLNEILNKTFYKQKDYVLFCFGEVDIRAHLLNQSTLQEKKVDEIVLECVTRYIDAIKFVNPKRKIQKAVFAPIASWSDEKPYDGPSYGSNLVRNDITRIFNNSLEKMCNQNNIKFISIFEDMLHQDGTTNSNFLDDWGSGIHLNQTAMPIIIDRLKSNSIL